MLPSFGRLPIPRRVDVVVSYVGIRDAPLFLVFHIAGIMAGLAGLFVGRRTIPTSLTFLS